MLSLWSSSHHHDGRSEEKHLTTNSESQSDMTVWKNFHHQDETESKRHESRVIVKLSERGGACSIMTLNAVYLRVRGEMICSSEGVLWREREMAVCFLDSSMSLFDQE